MMPRRRSTPTAHAARSAALIASFLSLSLLSLACGEDPEDTYLDIAIVADPNISSEATLVSALRSLSLVVDSPAGLYPGTTDITQGNMVIRDLDADGKAELAVSVDMSTLDRLPTIRLYRGGLSAASMALKIEGEAGGGGGTFTPGQKIAAGGVQGVVFSDGEAVAVKVPFNLKPAWRPPRVTQVFPDDGARGLSVFNLSSVVVFFSKEMDKKTLLAPGALQVLRMVGGKEILAPARIIQINTLYQGGPTRAEYQLRDALLPLTIDRGTFEIRISATVKDMAGQPLDQAPLQPGSQPFSSTFTVEKLSGSWDTWCAAGGDMCTQGLVCNKQTRTCEPKGCPKTCASELVCDTQLKACVLDCRPYGSFGGCPPDRPTCDAKTGLCR